MPKIIAFSGKSNSGKSTLICKLAEILRTEGKSVGVIKHDPKDKAEFDTKGREGLKDSYKFSCVAQKVAVISPNKSTIFSFRSNGDSSESMEATQQGVSAYELCEFERALEFFGACDYVFIEGLRGLPYRRIIVARGELDRSYLHYGVAIAMDRELRDRTDMATLTNLTVLDLNNPLEILEFIDKERVCKSSK